MLASKVVAHKLQRKTAGLFGDFVQSFFTELAIEVEKGSKSTRREMLQYQEAISYGSADGPSIRTRLNILTIALVAKHPEFAPLLGDAAGLKDFKNQAIAEKSEAISKQIYRINEKHAAKHGTDLFKMTNESVAAIKTLGMSCTNSEQHGKFIDAIYFLIYEGSGNCNRLPSPPPEFAMDVKFLRTGLRHDLDHGDKAEIVKKRIRKGNVFEKFSGKKTPNECGPEDFVATQLRILAAAQSFLEAL